MFKIILMTTMMVLIGAALPAEAAQRVKGYTTKNGTYVAPYYRSAPNGSRMDNYSSKGNENPFTGKKGYTDPLAPKPRKR